MLPILAVCSAPSCNHGGGSKLKQPRFIPVINSLTKYPPRMKCLQQPPTSSDGSVLVSSVRMTTRQRRRQCSLAHEAAFVSVTMFHSPLTGSCFVTRQKQNISPNKTRREIRPATVPDACHTHRFRTARLSIPRPTPDYCPPPPLSGWHSTQAKLLRLLRTLEPKSATRSARAMPPSHPCFPS